MADVLWNQPLTPATLHKTTLYIIAGEMLAMVRNLLANGMNAIDDIEVYNG